MKNAAIPAGEQPIVSHMKPHASRITIALSSLFLAAAGHSATIDYQANLSGALEAPTSPGTGTAEVILNTTANTMEVKVQFSGLLGTTIASHIHAATSAPLTGNADVATTVPTFPNFPLGVQSGTYDQTFDLTLAASYNPAYVTANGGTVASAEATFLSAIANGQPYLNIHTTEFPRWEIRG